MISPSAVPRRPLLQKYFLILFAVVVASLLANAAVEAWFGFHDRRALLESRLRAEAATGAAEIRSFLVGIRDQMGWAVQLPWTEADAEQHRIDALRLLRQIPAMVDLALVDGDGMERLSVSRIGRDVIGSGRDRAGDPAVRGAREAGVWYGPVTLNRGSEPYLTMAVAGNRRAVGVAVAEINLKLIWEVVAAIRVGEAGIAFVVDGNHRLVAHPDLNLVLQGNDDTTAARLRALASAIDADGVAPGTAGSLDGGSVLAAAAPVAGVDWLVFATQPLSEAYAPIRAALWRTGLMVLASAAAALGLAYLFARRMTVPIRRLEEGAARIGAGEFDHEIKVATGDELEGLANRLNRMAQELGLSQERSARITRLKAFLSPQVAELVERSGDGSLLEPRQAEVVVVFCDLRGFTEFASTVDAEDVMQVLGTYYEVVGGCVTRHEAALTHFSGDGIMILLNAPVVCPDDPALRAVRMAEDIRAEVGKLTVRWQARGHAIGCGIGIAQGLATVGRVGYAGRNDYTAIGNVVNLASRLCSAAADRQILVDPVAATTVAGSFVLRPLGTRAIKGFLKPVAVHALPDLF